MGKVKIKKQAIWIDMTPMSDVMVLLLTFFMLTSTFTKNEAVRVNTPGSVSEVKVPDKDVLTVLVDKTGKIFLGMDKPKYMEEMLRDMAGQYGVKLSDKGVANFKTAANVGVSMTDMEAFLKLDPSKYNDFQAKRGIPTDSVKGADPRSEFQHWVEAAKNAVEMSGDGKEFKLAIKADAGTPYKVVKKMMSELQDMNENRYYLITTLQQEQDDKKK